LPGKYIVIGVSLFMRVQDLTEATSTHIAFTFGRFNPPTIGHEKLINAVKAAAGKYRIYVSKTHDIKKNPLDYNTKMQYLNAMFPAANISNDKMKTILEIVVSLYDEGWENITLVVGDDRIADFDKMLNTYNGVEGKAHGYYNFNSINVVSAGQRDPDAEGAEGMSASKMRSAAVANDYDSFKQGLPNTFEHGEQLFKDVQQGMNL
jgi:DNA-binding ferritin-like protein (Dps family)